MSFPIGLCFNSKGIIHSQYLTLIVDILWSKEFYMRYNSVSQSRTGWVSVMSVVLLEEINPPPGLHRSCYFTQMLFEIARGIPKAYLFLSYFSQLQYEQPVNFITSSIIYIIWEPESRFNQWTHCFFLQRFFTLANIF